MPFYLTPFIGREREIAAICQLLPHQRLVTLTGVGGVGKTRLAVQAVAELKAKYPDGVYLVALAELADVVHLSQAVATALGLHELPTQETIEMVTQFLNERRALLMLDNCEHMLDACANLIAALLQSCPHLNILAISREPLGINGEITWSVPPLSTPNAQADYSARHLADYEAVRLFVERAAATSEFELTSENAALVARLCQHLDGIPLAIELAAAQVNVLSLTELVARLQTSITLLGKHRQTAPHHQQTLRATLDWSYNLLSPLEQALFKRLAVFAGGFSLAAAEVVCSVTPLSTPDVLPLLIQLVSKSLVVPVERGVDLRYRLLEPVRQYASEKLNNADELATVQTNHAHFFVEMVAEAEPHLRSGQRKMWLDRIDTELDNLRVVFRWCQSAGEVATELRLINALTWYWYFRRHIHEAHERVMKFINHADLPHFGPGYADTLWLAGALKWIQGDYAGAQQHLLACAGHCRQLEATDRLARALTLLGLITGLLDDYEAAYRYHFESLAIFEAQNNQWWLALANYWLADTYRRAGYDETSHAYYERAFTLFTGIDDSWGVSLSLQGLGSLAYRMRLYTTAQNWLEACLHIRRDLGDQWLTAQTLNTLAAAVAAQDDLAQAVGYLQEGLTLYREIGDRLGISYSLWSLGNIRLRQRDLLAAEDCFRECLLLQRIGGHHRRVVQGLLGLSII